MYIFTFDVLQNSSEWVILIEPMKMMTSTQTFKVSSKGLTPKSLVNIFLRVIFGREILRQSFIIKN